MKVFVVGDRRKGAAREALDNLLPWLRRRAEVVGVDLEAGAAPLASVRADLLLVLGGDGSILAAARSMGRNQIPALGVNFGRLGFLAAVRPQRMREVIADALEGRFAVEERLMAAWEVRRGDGKTSRGIALNDGAIERATRTGMITIELRLGGRPVTRYRGDGVIVATPTGATGYSLSAGGPIVGLGLDAFVVTPICPHTLTNRPLVVPASDAVDLLLVEGSPAAYFSADGQEWHALEEGDGVHVEAARERFRLAVVGGDFYARLRTTLGWRGAIEGTEEGGETSTRNRGAGRPASRRLVRRA